MSYARDSVRWAPFPGGPQQCRVVGATRDGTVPVRWETGPLAGREARVPSGNLKQRRGDAVECGDGKVACLDLLCERHGVLS